MPLPFSHPAMPVHCTAVRAGTTSVTLVSVAESACRDQIDYINCASGYTMALMASGSICGVTLTPTRSR